MGFPDAEWVTVGDGFKLFLWMSFGGAAVGVACALALIVVLYELDRRLEPSYDVLQVVAALSTAYIAYYVADSVTGMSGIVACTTTGIVSAALGKGLINDQSLMETYLGLMEHALNTLLFTLGGVVWGVVIAGSESRQLTSGLGWGYLAALYICVVAIRFVQVALFYPVFARIGLQSDCREALFLSFGGLRGSVGIALAVSFYRTIDTNTSNDEDYAIAAQFVFMSGGM